jgi:DNA replication protein DnaC
LSEADWDLQALIESQKSHIPETSYTTAFKSDCLECEGTGIFRKQDDDGIWWSRACKCRLSSIAEASIRKSGLGVVLDTWTLDAFITPDAWQQDLKGMATRYIDSLVKGGKGWFVVCGNVGSGKSHICTAIVKELLKAGMFCRYMQWVTDSRRIKALINDEELDEDILDKLKNAEVLFVDDLFKQGHKSGERPRPTDSDIRIAFEIFNARYTMNRPTIITSEWFLTDELQEMDNGVFSRVLQKANGWITEVKRDKGRNYRMDGYRPG